MTEKENALRVMNELLNSGYEAYMVGGCVRDALMNRPVHDYDITTNARPEEIMRVFGDYHVIPTGLKHGTVTVISEGYHFEVTAYRVDGEYSDSRRPDKVSFTSDIKEDLARRDFTMNAIAMDINGEVIDPFGGCEDIKYHIIRCVGEPEKRFTEDALRIMRALRFASQLGFDIENSTSEALIGLKERLDRISAERIREELDKLICGENCVEVMLKYSEVIVQIIPEFSECIGFQQHSPYHRYDVWEHIVRAVGAVSSDNVKLRRVMLFHDIGKPLCYTQDETGRGHFKGHGEAGEELTRRIMHRLRYDNRTIKDTCVLVKYHTRKFHDTRQIKIALSELGEDLFFELLHVKRADNSAKHDFVLAELAGFNETEKKAREMLAGNECLSIAQLAINGRELTELGIDGKAVGETLSDMLKLIIDGELENNKDVLINFAKVRNS